MARAPVIDVRSPGEFVRGHIPGAHSVPLFTDEERAVVGTLYKQQGRDAAVREGLRIVGPKLATIVDEARALAPDGRIGVHCWRGGERSGSVAWLLDKAGFTEVFTLKRGYKAFRQHVLEAFNMPHDLRVLGGYTGTGKTETLAHLRELGEQVIDLEGLAHHKGSSFGALGEEPQPTTEHFENLLVVDYGRFPKEELAEATRRIGKRLGPQHCKAALEALDAGDMRTVALITLHYYDKAYLRGAEGRDPQRVVKVPASAHDLRGLAQRLKDHVAAATAR